MRSRLHWFVDAFFLPLPFWPSDFRGEFVDFVPPGGPSRPLLSREKLGEVARMGCEAVAKFVLVVRLAGMIAHLSVDDIELLCLDDVANAVRGLR